MDWFDSDVVDCRDTRLDLGERLLKLREIYPNLPAHVLADMIERGEDVYEPSSNGVGNGITIPDSLF